MSLAWGDSGWESPRWGLLVGVLPGQSLLRLQFGAGKGRGRATSGSWGEGGHRGTEMWYSAGRASPDGQAGGPQQAGVLGHLVWSPDWGPGNWWVRAHVAVAIGCGSGCPLIRSNWDPAIGVLGHPVLSLHGTQ